MLARITCIRKPDRMNSHEAIESIGYTKQDGTRWTCSRLTAVRFIEEWTLSFYVQVGNNIVAVTTSTSENGNKYIKTKPDHTGVDNLLSLSECPL